MERGALALIRTGLLLIVTLLVVPVLAFTFDQPLTPGQWALLRPVTALMLGVALLCFVTGELTGNVSQVDKLWSIVPVAYAWMITAQAGYDARMVLMSAVATVWGIRLTYNFSRHGAYQWKFWGGHEDYRWAHVRKTPGLDTFWGWKLFHLCFICLYQNALLLMLVLPLVVVQAAPGPLGPADWALAAAFVGLVAFETAADQQQWNFQQGKKREGARGRYAAGFISEGLWARSRHPNYFAEQSIWVTFFLFSVAATGRLNWSVAGCLLLMLLFQGSANLSERLQAQKYPGYPDYQKRTPRFIPRLG
jgi:steroid 5-alpha reductase family enzyme